MPPLVEQLASSIRTRGTCPQLCTMLITSSAVGHQKHTLLDALACPFSSQRHAAGPHHPDRCVQCDHPTHTLGSGGTPHLSQGRICLLTAAALLPAQPVHWWCCKHACVNKQRLCKWADTWSQEWGQQRLIQLVNNWTLPRLSSQNCGEVHVELVAVNLKYCICSVLNPNLVIKGNC
jgi:hypothetical protein